MESGLGGKVAFITGASGGIGRALAVAFAGEGCSLLLHGHRGIDELRAWAAGQPWADRAHCVAADLRDPVALQAAAAEGAERFGRLDLCVANAGKWPPADEPLQRMDPARFLDTLQVNLAGAAFTARAFLRTLEERGPREDGDGASITFIGSTAGRFGERFHADYSASKAGMYGLVRSLKNEVVALDPFARVNMVEPGWTVTRMARPALQDDDTVRRVVQTMPMQQLGRADDIARAVLWLSSPRLARHVSGEVLTVAGGMEGRVLHDPQQVELARLRARLAGEG